MDVDATDGFPQAIIDLSVVKEAVRRRRWLLVAVALAGLVLGAALQFAVPGKYDAITNLYMSEPANSDPAAAIANDVSLLETRAVAQKAVTALKLHVSAADFLTTYEGGAVSNELLSIKLTAASSSEAVTYDNALAKAFLSLRSSELTHQTNLVVTDIDAQVEALNADITHLSTSIDALSGGAPGPQATDQLTELVDQRSSDAAQISSLQAEVNQDLINENAVIWGTQVLDPAAGVRVSVKKATVEDALAGLIAGLALGLGALIVAAVVSDRPRRRADVAGVLGAPVELSVGRYRRCRWLRKWRLRRRIGDPRPDVRLIVRRLRAHLLGARTPALAVVAVEAPELAAVSVGALAFSLASEGKRVVVADMAEGRPLASLFGLARGRDLSSPVTVTLGGASVTMVAAPDDVGLAVTNSDVVTGADAILVLATVTPSLGADHLVPWAASAVVMLTAGKVSATRIASCGQVLRQARVPVRSAILVGASPYDETFGADSAELLLPQRPTHARKIEEDLAALSRNSLRENGDRTSGEVKAIHS